MSQTQGHHFLQHIKKQVDIWSMSNSPCFSAAAKQPMLMLTVSIFKFPPALPTDHSSGGFPTQTSLEKSFYPGFSVMSGKQTM